MTWQDFQHEAPATPPAPANPGPASPRRPDGLRRTILTAGIAGALLVTGGVAAVFAATPDPSTTPAPSATTDQSGGGTSTPQRDRQGRDGQPCPDKDGASGDGGSGGSGSSGSDGSGGQSAQPSPSTATPAT
jgi:hypothetical protein